MSRTSLQRGFSDPLLPPHTCKCRPRKRRTAAELLVFRFFWAVQLGVRSADRLTDLSLVLRLVSASTLWLGCCHQPGGSQALLQCRDQRKEESKQWLVICVSSWRQNKRLELWFWLLSLLGTCDLFSFTDVPLKFKLPGWLIASHQSPDRRRHLLQNSLQTYYTYLI